MDTTRASLLIRIRNRGDEFAWKEFDSLYRPMLHRFAAARGLSDADAEDVVQYCMAAINKHITTFDYDPKKGRFKGWLRTMVNNRIRTLRRDRRRDIPATQSDLEKAGSDLGPDEVFDKVWREEHLAYCLRLVRKEVEDSTFRAFRAYVIDALPTAEVCRKFNMTRNQVHLIKWRVTQRLREHMRELLGEDGLDA